MGAGASVPDIVTLDAALAHTGPLGIADARVTEATRSSTFRFRLLLCLVRFC